MSLNFKIEQVALAPHDPEKAIALLARMGAGEWARDHVKASGRVFGVGGTNEADLAFEYDILKDAKELEVLHYTDGPNWLEENAAERVDHDGRVSHLGMHCTERELAQWKFFFQQEGIREAQSVRTFSHTNPVIAGKRTYQYVIFDTRAILGVDIKFIVRL